MAEANGTVDLGQVSLTPQHLLEQLKPGLDPTRRTQTTHGRKCTVKGKTSLAQHPRFCRHEGSEGGRTRSTLQTVKDKVTGGTVGTLRANPRRERRQGVRRERRISRVCNRHEEEAWIDANDRARTEHLVVWHVRRQLVGYPRRRDNRTPQRTKQRQFSQRQSSHYP
jgi:hypothetical protein